MNYIDEFDVICFVETWIDDIAIIEASLQNFMIFLCPSFRSVKGGRNMAGVVILVKLNLSLKPVRICSEFEFGILLKFGNVPLKSSTKNIVLACIYIPPEGSPIYSRVDQSVLESLEDSFMHNDVLTEDTNVILCGDFNSRTGTLQEFDLNDLCNVSVLEEYSDILLPKVDIPRCSADKTINRLGRNLINFLKSYQLYIVNGRMGEDMNSGDFTYIDTSGCSVIDYFICSADIFSSIMNFRIDNNGALKHLPLQLTLSFSIDKTESVSHGDSDSCQTKYIFQRELEDKELYNNILTET